MQKFMKKWCVLLTMGAACSTANAQQTPQQLPQELPIPNAGFEDDVKNWSAAERFKGQISVVAENPHSGQKTLQIKTGTPANSPWSGNGVSGLEPGATYRLSAWVRGEVGQADTTAAVKIEFYNAKGENPAGYYGQRKLKGDGKWQPITVTAAATTDTVRAAVLMRLMGPGTIYFDDVKFEKVKNAPDIAVSGSTMLAVEQGQRATATYQVTLKKAWTETTLPPFAVHVRENIETLVAVPPVVVQPRVEKIDDRHFNLSAQLPPIEGNDQKIEIALGDLRSEQNLYAFVVPKPRQPKYLTDNGTILHNGKPFFPIGMYHPYNPETDYPLLAANGFNAVQGAGGDIKRFKELLDLAQQNGLAVDVPFYANGQVKKNLESSLEKIRLFADHPAVLCWKIIDEPDIASNDSVAAEVPAAYRAFKAADPNHPIELTMAHDATLPFWTKFCDLVQIDRYPVPSRPLTDVSDFSRNAIAAMEPWQNLTFVVQSGWVADLGNQPNVPQARSMVYLALTSGAKGIFWYSMREPAWDLTTTPFWPEMKAINQEIAALSTPIMLGRDVKEITSSEPKVHFIGKQHDGKLYLLVTNPENTPARVAFTLPARLGAKNGRHLSAHRDGGKAPVALAGNTFSLDLGAIDSRTIIFDVK